jgi:hypothetical protein
MYSSITVYAVSTLRSTTPFTVASATLAIIRAVLRPWSTTLDGVTGSAARSCEADELPIPARRIGPPRSGGSRVTLFRPAISSYGWS